MVIFFLVFICNFLFSSSKCDPSGPFSFEVYNTVSTIQHIFNIKINEVFRKDMLQVTLVSEAPSLIFHTVGNSYSIHNNQRRNVVKAFGGVLKPKYILIAICCWRVYIVYIKLLSPFLDTPRSGGILSACLFNFCSKCYWHFFIV